jgi:hypothetical protein
LHTQLAQTVNEFQQFEKEQHSYCQKAVPDSRALMLDLTKAKKTTVDDSEQLADANALLRIVQERIRPG